MYSEANVKLDEDQDNLFFMTCADGMTATPRRDY